MMQASASGLWRQAEAHSFHVPPISWQLFALTPVHSLYCSDHVPPCEAQLPALVCPAGTVPPACESVPDVGDVEVPTCSPDVEFGTDPGVSGVLSAYIAAAKSSAAAR